MSAEAIAAIFTGLTGLVAALAAFTANRSRRLTQDTRSLKRRVRLLEKQVLALVEHTFTLELELARGGLKVPDRPLILEQLDADLHDEDPPAAASASSASPGGRHTLRGG